MITEAVNLNESPQSCSIFDYGKFALLVTVSATFSENILDVATVPRRWTCM